MLAQTTMTSKGQNTIPKEIRESLGLQPYDKLSFSLLSDGTVIMRAKKGSIRSVYGMFYQADRPVISIEEMQRP